MTTTFPPKPWQEGATFTNDTTGVGYTYTGGKWLASGGPKVEGEYLPLSGGKLTGQLTIQADGDAFSIQKKDGGGLLTTFTGSYSSDIQYWKQAKDYSNSKLEIVNGFKLEEYVAEEIGKLPEPSPTTSPFRKFKYAGDRVWANMRPGEFQMLDKDQNITSELDKCQAIIFKGEDADGNRAVRDEKRHLIFQLGWQCAEHPQLRPDPALFQGTHRHVGVRRRHRLLLPVVAGA